MRYFTLLALLLAGCTATPVLEPGPEIDVPVAVHCQHAPLIKPIFPLQTLAKTTGTAQLLQACLQSDLLRQAYELECESIVNACQ